MDLILKPLGSVSTWMCPKREIALTNIDHWQNYMKMYIVQQTAVTKKYQKPIQFSNYSEVDEFYLWRELDTSWQI